ncbi:type VII secretion protein EccB [Streptomyces mirabilis]|uniref:type VII secretion protein EccB n=1 Tax=Streptomyces mirabilis TaxID=68239 RepID=UPI0036B9E4BD
MQTRKDHVQAYRFAAGRLSSALVSGEANTEHGPMRRAALGSMIGILLAFVLVLGFGAYGYVSPVETAWRQDGAFVAEKESGTRFIYHHGELHPVRNYASALLALGRFTQPKKVTAGSLNGLPTGREIGIVGAPDSVPPAGGLLAGSWTYCLHPGRAADRVLDFAPGKRAEAVPGDQRLLVSSADGTRYVVWQAAKYRVSQRSALIALGLDAVTPVTAPKDWLKALPTKTPLAAAGVAGYGSAGPRVGGKPTKVGQLLATSLAGRTRSYVVRSDGVAPVNATESALLVAAHGGTVRRVSPAALAATPSSADRSLLTRLPDLLHTVDVTGSLGTGSPSAASRTGSALCLRQQLQPYGHGLRLSSTVVREDGAAALPGSRVLVPSGQGILAQPPRKSEYEQVQQYLISDQGRKFPLGDTGAAAALGLNNSLARTLPANVLALVPTGPTLSTSAALATISGG